MKLYISQNTSAYFTLPFEEILARNLKQDENIVFLYQHKNVSIVGKNQNTNEEVDLNFIEENGIELARRISGGGAVYQDLGNINFSFITSRKNGKTYKEFLEPVLEFLKSLGLNASFKGRNDLVINDSKISGNSQFILENAFCHHGTLLFDVDFSKMSKVLIPNKLKIASKGIKSIRQRVTNIREELKQINQDIDSKTFLEKLKNFFIEKGYQLSDLPIKQFEKELLNLSEIRKSKEWIFGKNPKFEVSEEAKFEGGILKVKYNVEKNHFTNFVFEGDFLSSRDVKEIEEKIINLHFDRNEFSKILDTFELQEYFGKIEKKEILDLIF
ncbi:lipoate--protein ligase [[Mycoplasma] mobile]|uniref:lipoate--protein ligase n=1 Tax=Mycoplasma mobile (strain ATCC 43663 / 163K / NCTC 11711) TaxID=267748 RepID=Q6KIN2_MYCM1|nr:lipoate--protein ligase [[Mycoplasma] mobile]AAT27544.1 lipoate-protein ligase [Mycoplasma mobile 163K]